ncbi:hypothetical protein G6F57_019882 [Rhizopus arrhizus]|nr:hypothetical protein G6F65_019946 [Rhizopus arrhizus]KAG1372270.1 hypothetical protein G6F60_015612 [Rhizopus arrhizus]KAG1438368.1 hypothetical protein G6F57_019882 [Rhizopus arrhizus]
MARSRRSAGAATSATFRRDPAGRAARDSRATHRPRTRTTPPARRPRPAASAPRNRHPSPAQAKAAAHPAQGCRPRALSVPSMRPSAPAGANG